MDQGHDGQQQWIGREAPQVRTADRFLELPGQTIGLLRVDRAQPGLFVVPGLDELPDLLLVQGRELKGLKVPQLPLGVLIRQGAAGHDEPGVVVRLDKGGDRVANEEALFDRGNLIESVQDDGRFAAAEGLFERGRGRGQVFRLQPADDEVPEVVRLGPFALRGRAREVA